MENEEYNIDELTKLPIRATDNSLRERDIEASQSSEPLELDESGLPIGWEAPNGDR